MTPLPDRVGSNDWEGELLSQQPTIKVVREVEQVPITEINMAKYNPRTASQGFLQKLQTSITKHGFVDPVIVNRRSRDLGFDDDEFQDDDLVPTVVGGHQRIKAAMMLGMEKVPVVWVELPPVAERELNVALNKIEADWEGELLASTLKWIEDHGGVTTDTGFEEHEIRRLMEATQVEVPEDFPDVDVEGLGGGRPSMIACPSCGYEFDPEVAKAAEDA